jgi:hypothetical protein
MNFTYTFGNGDTYSITGSYAASYSTALGSTISFDPTVTYMGASPSVAADTLTLTMFQNYFDTTPGSWAGNYTETIPLSISASAPAGSSAEGQITYDGMSVGLVGPITSGSMTKTITTALDFGALDTSNTLAAQAVLTFTFGKGAPTGASVSSLAAPAVPEPALVIPGGLCLLAMVFAARRRNRSRVAM